MLLKSARFCMLLCLLLCCGLSRAQDAAFSKKLDSLKSKNNLEDWLYERIDQATATPQLLPVLFNTQKQAWRKPANVNEHIAWLSLLTTQGYEQLLAGDILSSISYYEDAYSWYYKYQVAEFDAPEYIFKPLSNNYTRLGDYERAVFIQQKTVEYFKRNGTGNDVASAYSNMAITYYSMGNYPEAEACIVKGEKMVKDAAIRFRLQNIQADILYDEGKLQKALALQLRNISAQKSINPQTAYNHLGAYTTLGRIELKAGMLQDAEKHFNTALILINKWFKGDRLREKANITAQLGKVKRLSDQPREALILFNQALRILRINTAQNQTQPQLIYGENNLVDIFHEKALTYRQLKQPGIALQNMRYALLATDKIRGEFADNKTKERLQQDGKALAETTIEMALDLYQTSKNKNYLNLVLEITEQTKARTLADQIQRSNRQMLAGAHDTILRKRIDIERAIVYNERMMMLEKNNAKYQQKINTLKYDLSLLNKTQRGQMDGSVLTANAILAALPANVHTVEYFFGTRSVYAIDIQNRAVNRVPRIGNADTLRKQLTYFINTYFRGGPEAMLNSPKQFYQVSNSLFTILLGDIDMQPNEHLCIVADDVLGYLSFDGLITNSNYTPAFSLWPYLVKKATTSYAFSLNALVKNKTATTGRGTFSGLFVTHEGNNNAPIIAVKKEAAAIGKLVSGNYLYDDAVNTRSFFDAFENSAALHISTHAYLSGVDQEPTLDFGKEKLFLFELLAKRNKPDLVILSACRTGDGLLAKGEGIISLSRGFSAIGTPATIAGLWNVNDDAVAQITAGVYQHLLKGQSSGTALHQAKLNWLNTAQTTDAMYLPYYWDSLILMGADKPVHLQAANNDIYIYAGAAVLLALILVWLAWRKHRAAKP
jgi:tetratricopeptide (TPR) repeat protein